MTPTPKVTRVACCERCGESEARLYVIGNVRHLCESCVRIMVRVATVWSHDDEAREGWRP